MAGGKNIDINNLREAANLLRDIQGMSLNSSLSSAKANAELKEFLDTNSAYKDVLKELAELEERIQNARDIKNKREENKLLKEKADFLERHKKQLGEIKDKTEEINNVYRERYDIDSKIEEMQKGINVELEKERRAVNKAYELYQLQTKEIREGLTYEEKRHQILTKIGEKMKINTDQFKKGFSDIKQGFEDFKNGINGLNKAWGEVSQSSADFTRRIGGSKASMEALRKSTIDFMNTRSIGLKYNASMEELIKLQGDYNASLGRSIDLTGNQQEKFIAMKRVMGDQAAMEFTTKLENFGLNPDEVGDRVGQMFSKAAKSGIAFEKYSKNFLDNIKLAQNYNFKNGLRGLESMAKKATEIKMDMQQVARFADKVSTLEGAVTAGANLSVLGGPFAQFGNPLQMLYEGLNDMEGLQDRMINMFGNLGKWDYSKGQIDVSVFNKQRIKAAAEATGMDYSALMEQINAGARRNIVKGKLGNRYSGDKDFEDLLLNKAQLDEKGNAFVTIRGERKDINSLSKEDQNYLKTSNTSDSDNIAEIAVNTRGFKDISEGFDKQKDAYSANFNETLHIGEYTQDILNSVGKNGVLMTVLGVGKDTLSAIHGTLKAFYGTYLMFGALGKGGLGGVGSGVGGETREGFGLGGNFGKKYNYTMHKNGMASVPGTKGFIKPTTGMKFMKGVGRFGGIGGAALGAAGALGGMAIDNSEWGRNRSEHASAYGWAKAGTGALTGMGTGAMIGSMFGPIGTLVGAGVGLLGGALYSGISGYKEAKAEADKKQIAENLKSSFNARINDPNVYTVEELTLMNGGSGSLPPSLKEKMYSYGDNLGGHAFGGSVKENITGTINGNGGPRDDKVAMYASPGEYIVNAESAAKYRPELDFINAKRYVSGGTITSGGDNINTMSVSSNNNQGNNTNSLGSTLSLDPIDINVNGVLTLSLNGQTTNIDSKVLIDSLKPVVIDYINEQLLNRKEFRIARNKTHDKFGIGMA